MLRVFDAIIVGSGAAGLAAALHLAGHSKVAIIAKTQLQSGSTPHAQGGIAAVQAAEDNIRAHIKDTMVVGDGLCDYGAVKHTVTHARQAIDWLISQGVDFSKSAEANYHLNQEGGHSYRRIFHVEDATGRALSEVLIERVRAHPNIALFEEHVAVDLIQQQARVVGLYVYDESRARVARFIAPATLLTSGGASAIYYHTTSPAISSGDGIAMAYRAGARIANMEFNQFHPTCLYHPQSPPFLISEALRGEGAQLLLPDGSRFMQRFDAREELAPRDVVARAIDFEMKRLGLDCVYLSIAHRPESFIAEHFPNILKHCRKYGIDIARQPIPVVPAAHYTCGGVMVNQHAQTDLPGLYAAGEVSYTGLHGANRMASNSLIECLVYAQSAAEHILLHPAPAINPKFVPAWDESQVVQSNAQVIVTHNRDEVRRLMWNYVGIVRSNEKLKNAARRLHIIHQEVQQYYSRFLVNRELLELRNTIMVADLMIRSALARKESRGLHYTIDYPDKNPDYLAPTILTYEPATLKSAEGRKARSLG